MNRSERQKGLEVFVQREIYLCQTGLVEQAIKNGLFSVDEIENLYRQFDAKLLDPSVCAACGDSYPCLDSETGECISCFEEQQFPQEIFEWWLVSPWLCHRLLFAGEPILNNEFGIWWGRTTSGQAISMDYVIEQIYDELMG